MPAEQNAHSNPPQTASELQAAIDQSDGENSFEKWLKKNPTRTLQQKSGNLCPQCKQDTIVETVQSFQGDEGFKLALAAKLGRNKTKYAQPIAEQLSKLPLDKWPPRIIEFFGKIQTLLNLP